MLQRICESIHNYFIQESYIGTFTIASGAVSPLSLLEGQRFWLTGSALNDGIYTYHAEGIANDDDNQKADLLDETFTGTICALAIPRELSALALEVNDWLDQYGKTLASPYQSESVIGVYNYTKATASKVGGGSGIISWQDVFADRLKRWRKICL